MAKVQRILGIVGFKERRCPGSSRWNYRWGHFRPNDWYPSMALLEVICWFIGRESDDEN